MLTRWQLWALVVLAFGMALFGVRAKWVSDGEAKLRAKIAAQKAAALETARGIENEVEALDRTTLKRRASVWVRDGKR